MHARAGVQGTPCTSEKRWRKGRTRQNQIENQASVRVKTALHQTITADVQNPAWHFGNSQIIKYQ